MHIQNQPRIQKFVQMRELICESLGGINFNNLESVAIAAPFFVDLSWM